MTQTFHELLLSELRMVVYQPGDPSRLNDRLLCEAVTLNENLQSLGFVLKPDDLAKLAVSPSLHGFYGHLRSLIPDVAAQPMYPGFPQQVMEMSEAEFRMHQMMHYFSTYGLESIFGVQVSRGWLPACDGPVRDRQDTTLPEARVLDLTVEEEAPLQALSILLARRERLTNPELDLVLECAPVCTAAQMQGLNVRFKENLDLLFPRLVQETDRATALRTLRAICAHCGDVLRCTAAYLSRKKYHLTTSEKKLLVKLLEQYPVGNFRLNLMQSLQIRERNLTVLRHLDYNRYSRSAEHAEAVRALRSGELLSWHGVSEELLKTGDPKALTHLAQRPGYMIRMLNRLLGLGYSREAIENALLPQAGRVSAHLIVRVLRTLHDHTGEIQAQYAQKLKDVSHRYQHRARRLDPHEITWRYIRDQETCHRCYQEEREMTSLEDLDRQYAAERQACLQRHQREAQENTPEALELQYHRYRDGLRQELAKVAEKSLREPEAQARKTAAAMVYPVRQELNQLRARYKSTFAHAYKRWPHLKALIRYIRENADLQDKSDEEILLRYYPRYLQADPQRLWLEDKIRLLQDQVSREQAKADAWLELELKKLSAESANVIAAAKEDFDCRLAQLEQEHRARLQDAPTLPARQAEELAQLDRKYQELSRNTAERRRTLPAREAEELAQLKQRYQQELDDALRQLDILKEQETAERNALEEQFQAALRRTRFDAVAVEILKDLLKAHFRQAVTPLQGKKVFLQMQQFDLKHSVLETSNRSKDGGYIRSGIAWKIPDDAKYVRFFTYWNDHARVDIDLHAGAVATNGRSIHVGWNADFRNSGVIHSGDITHSNAAEYIDIDLSAPIREISTNVHLFRGKHSFREIKTCYVGMMAVDQMGQNVELYSPKNCFFTHKLTQNVQSLFYGFVDVQNRCVRFVGQPNKSRWDSIPRINDTFSLQDYLDCVLDAQQVQIVDNAEDADVILSMGKCLRNKGISLVDHNFFLEC